VCAKEQARHSHQLSPEAGSCSSLIQLQAERLPSSAAACDARLRRKRRASGSGQRAAAGRPCPPGLPLLERPRLASPHASALAGGCCGGPSLEPFDALHGEVAALEASQELKNSGLKVSQPHGLFRCGVQVAGAQASGAARQSAAKVQPTSQGWRQAGDEAQADLDELSELQSQA
jgi:hypothetical protein